MTHLNAKIYFTLLILFLVIFPIHLLHSAAEVNTNPSEDASIGSIKDIQKTFLEKTPDFLSEPIIKSLTWLENVRQEAGSIAELKTKELAQEVKEIDEKYEQNNTGALSKEGLAKMLKHAQLFFYSFISLVLNTKLIFYIVFPLGILLSIKYLWSFIF